LGGRVLEPLPRLHSTPCFLGESSRPPNK